MLDRPSCDYGGELLPAPKHGRCNGTARRRVGLLHIGNPYGLQQRPLTDPSKTAAETPASHWEGGPPLGDDLHRKR